MFSVFFVEGRRPSNTFYDEMYQAWTGYISHARDTASFGDEIILRSGNIHITTGLRPRSIEAKDSKSHIKMPYLNVPSLKPRENFCLVNDTKYHNNFDVFTISETYADETVSSKSLRIIFYQLFRQNLGLKGTTFYELSMVLERMTFNSNG